MAFDAHKNFAYSTVATAPSPATSGTTLNVQTGDGALFPAAPFNVTVWPAGVQPNSGNAEIVRVTSKGTGDNWTITRTQESTSARSITVGDQIANTITAKVLTDIEGVAAPTGVAATDTANIQAAHDALPSGGGMIRLQAGTYVLNASAPLSFTKPVYLKGQGMEITILTLDSATVTAITSTGNNCVFEDFTVRNNHATAPTAGAGIAITGGGGRNRYRDVMIDSFYYGLDQQYGNGWVADGCFVYQYKKAGIRVQNVAATDSGDGEITNCQIASTYAATTNGILFNSGGNLRIIGNQLYGGDAGNSNVGIVLAPLDGINTSDVLIFGNSIENFIYGVQGQLPGSATGVLGAIQVSNNEFYATALGDCVNFDMGTTSRFSEIIITGNRMTNGSRGLVLGKVDAVTFSSNQGLNNTPITVNAGVTNVNQNGTMTKLFDSTLGADTASIDTGAVIPGGFGTLLVQFQGRCSDLSESAAVNITLNNDTAANYNRQYIFGSNTTISTGHDNATQFNGTVFAANAPAGYAGMIEMVIPNYANTTFYKNVRLFAGNPDNPTPASSQVAETVGIYLSTSAITRIKFAGATGNLKAGSRLVIYGLP